MMTTITLPDHISFEEIAAKWCDLEFINEFISHDIGLETYIHFSSGGQMMYFYIMEYSPSCCGANIDYDGPVAYIYLNDRRITVLSEHVCSNLFNEDVFKPILDFIKERSNV